MMLVETPPSSFPTKISKRDGSVNGPLIVTRVLLFTTWVFFESGSYFPVLLRFHKVDTIPPIFLF